MKEQGTALITLFILTIILILINTLSTFELPSLELQLLTIILIGLALLVIGYTYKGKMIEQAHEEPTPESLVDKYIKRALIKGLDEQKIREQLTHAGWQTTAVNQAFRRVRFL